MADNNKLVESKFMYTVEISYISDKDEYDLDYRSIKALSITYNYEKYTQPLIILSINIKSSILNKMKKRAKLDKIYLKIQKYDTKSKSKTKKTYIEEQFTYYFSDTDLDYSTDIDNEAYEDNTQSNAYVHTQLALLKTELVHNVNNKIYNGVYKNGDIMSVVLDNMPNIGKCIIEPFDNKKQIKNLVIMPMTGIVNLLKYLNKKYTFYNTNYRFFMDYKKTYLLSKKGKAIDIKDGTYNNIKVEVKGNLEEDSRTIGMVSDSKNKIYIIPIDSNNITTDIDLTSEKNYNNIYAVDTSGKAKNTKLNIHKSKDTATMSKIYKVSDGNMDYIKSIQSDLELNSCLINLVKADLDVSVITPNKQFMIEHIKDYKSLNGNYMIMLKQEIYTIQDDEFRCSCMLTLAKIPSSK